MQFTGKRTYIMAVACAIIIIIFWYVTKNTDVLTGLIPSGVMVGMRKVTAQSFVGECNKLVTSNKNGDDKSMVFGLTILSITKIGADITAMVDTVNKVIQKFANDPDVVDMGTKIDAVLADFGLGSLLSFKR